MLIKAPGMELVKEKISAFGKVTEIKKEDSDKNVYMYAIYCDGNAFQFIFDTRQAAEYSLQSALESYNNE